MRAEVDGDTSARWFWIGAAIGAASGAMFVATSFDESAGGWGFAPLAYAVYVPVGAIAGAFVIGTTGYAIFGEDPDEGQRGTP